MTDGPFQRLRRFLAELKRRKVYRVAAVYTGVAFVTLQAARLIFPSLAVPGWVFDTLVVITLFGFPIAVVLAWAFEMSPEGMRRTPEAEPAVETEAPETATRTTYKALVGLGLLAAAVAGGWYLTGSGGDTTVRDRSVAVLPFETLGDTSQSTFTEGLPNDLLTRLQRISALTVIARPSVMRYEDTGKPLSRVAEELNARWIVTAAVQQVGEQVQVNPRLIDPRTGTESWSDSYEGDLSAEEVFSLQEEITRSIAEALQTELDTGERERVEERPTGDLDAYRLYVEGRRQFARRSGTCPNCVEEAVKLFREAIERDSSFALAWTGLADAAALYPSEVPDSVVTPGVRQETAARRALELDPDLAEAHASMGFFYYGRHDAPAALRELRRAIDLNPSYWEAHQWLGWLYAVLDRRDAALEHFRLAVELNPQHTRARHGLYDAYEWVGKHRKSLREARRQQRMGLEHLDAVGGEVRALIPLGRLEEARTLAEKQVAKFGLDRGWGRWFRVYLIEILALQGDTTQAREYLDQLRDADIPPIYVASAYRRLGDPARALEAMTRLDEEHWGSWLSMAGLHELGREYPAVRDDPRYRKLLQEANQYWGLNPDGSLPDSVDVSFGAKSDD